jgi:hypothetical protein
MRHIGAFWEDVNRYIFQLYIKHTLNNTRLKSEYNSHTCWCCTWRLQPINILVKRQPNHSQNFCLLKGNNEAKAQNFQVMFISQQQKQKGVLTWWGPTHIYNRINRSRKVCWRGEGLHTSIIASAEVERCAAIDRGYWHALIIVAKGVQMCPAARNARNMCTHIFYNLSFSTDLIGLTF